MLNVIYTRLSVIRVNVFFVLHLDPRFVSVHLIPESDNPEDDKIFLFFRENAIDGEQISKATHARIGQLCKVQLSQCQILYNTYM